MTTITLTGQYQRICVVCRFSLWHGLAAVSTEFHSRRQLVAAFFTMVHGYALVVFGAWYLLYYLGKLAAGCVIYQYTTINCIGGK